MDEAPDYNQYSSHIVYLLREGHTLRQSAVDKQACGLLPESDWLRIIEEAGSESKRLAYEHSDFKDEVYSLFRGLKPDN